MTSYLVIGVHIAFSAYFLFRLLTVNPFLPKPRPHQNRIPLFHTIFLLLSSSLPLILTNAPFKQPAFAASWSLASLCAIRYTYQAPLFEYDTVDPSLLHYPRLLLWRFDVLVYVLFVLGRIAFTAPFYIINGVITAILALSVITVTTVDVIMRLQAQLIPITPFKVVSALLAPGHPIVYPQQAPPTVYDAPAFLLLSFDWATQTIVTGRERPLEFSDIIPMTDKYQSHVSSIQRFMPHWEEQLRRAPPAKPSVGRALFKAFGLRLVLGGSLKILNDMCLFISPLILKKVIEFIQDRDTKPRDTKEGIILAFCLFFTYLSQTTVFNQYFNINSSVEALVRGTLTANVYHKSCRLSPKSRGRYTTGQIQNLMSNDSRTVAEVVLYIHMLWSSLEQVIVAMVLLVQLLGFLPAFAGVAFLLFAIPLQSFLISNIRDLREKASSCTDERVKVVSEVIKGIKLVKLYAWELSFVKRILKHRAKELEKLKQMAIFQAWSGVTYTAVPTVLTLIVFAVYVLLGNALDAAVVFPAISLFNVLRPAMIIFPFVLVNCARAAASLSRLQGFLTTEELVPLEESEHAVDQQLLDEEELDILATDAAFTWNPSSETVPNLSSISLSVPRGSLVAIVGNTGCGKSTLMYGLLGEVPIVDGKAGIKKGRSVSFCDQVPFIQNATVKDNILFGKPFIEEQYRTTIRVCCLEPDLQILPAGDMTELGGKGVNLSGGQRARVSLARAVYSHSDICLLDDPLSAVDAHVAKAIFRDCITGVMKGQTRVLTTNQIHFATSSEVDMIVVVKEGVVTEAGNRRELMESPTSEFSKLLESAGEVTELEDTAEDKENGGLENGDLENRNILLGEPIAETNIGNDNATDKAVEPVGVSTDIKTSLTKDNKTIADYGAAEAGRLTKKEGKEKGRVQLKHYITYITSMGLFQWALPVFVLALAFNGFQLSVNLWMSYWSDLDPATETENSRWFNLVVFFFLGMGSLVASVGMMFCIAFGSIRASVLIHEKLLLSVLGAPSSFFNSNPEGRIVNRFTSDMDKLDQSLASTLQALNRLVISLIFTVGLIVIIMPPFIIVVIPIVMFCVYVQEFYRKTSVDVRRLEALSRSPLYSHFSETLDGVVTLRAYSDIPRATHINNSHTDQLNRTMFASAYINRWLSLRLEGLGTFLILSATLAAVLYPPGSISSGLVGLILSYTMSTLGIMTWTVRQFTDTESQMSAMERISEYSSHPFPQEETGGLENLLQSLQSHSTRMSRTDSLGLISKEKVSQLNMSIGNRRSRWPKKGLVNFENIEMRYREDLQPALRDVSLEIKPGEHVGICGRTGAGKSSAIQCLFRLYELEKGRILIDGQDISKIRLYDLRSSLGVIPQEPVCFSGTIRTNLDMFGEHDDEEVERALDACGLRDTMRESVGLDFTVNENGSNLSVGQRQLLCLGRALLKDSQVVVLDEATSNVSNEVDEKIQQTLRDEMAHCTVLTVAHRLHTVIASDRIVVMDKGKIAEVGTPHDLLSRPSMFGDLVNETGQATAAYLRQLAFTAGGKVIGEKGMNNRATREQVGTRKGYNKRSRHNLAEEGLVGLNGEGTVNGTMREAFEELRSALNKIETVEATDGMSELGDQKGAWRELSERLMNRLSVVGEGLGNGSSGIPGRAIQGGAAEDFAAEIVQNGSSPRVSRFELDADSDIEMEVVED